MKDGEIEKEVSVFMGDGFLKAGELDKALKAYELAGVKILQAKFIECGDLLLKKGYLYTAIAAYRMAEKEIPIDKLVECGNICFLNGDRDHALESYRLAKDKTKLLELGDTFVKRGWLDDARRAYKAAIQLP